MLPTIDKNGLNRFARYTAVGVSTFAFDLALLWILIETLALHYTLAAGLAFLVAVTINYFISRRVAFAGTARPRGSGLALFLTFALAGAGVVAGLMWLITTYAGLEVVLTRVLIAGIIGIGTYLMNLYVNFKVVGTPISPDQRLQ